MQKVWEASMTTKVTGPLFKWYGSKWSLSKHYPRPEYPTIVEPYAGSAGYSLRYPDREVYLYDTHPPLKNLWKWLIHEATEANIREIPIGLPVGTDLRTIGISLDQARLCQHWQRTNNLSECWTISPWGNKPGQWTANTRARVAEEIQAIKHWKFVQTVGLRNATYFIDPPYEYNYRYGGLWFCHEELADRIAALPVPNQVIACEAAHPVSGKVPTYLPFEPFRKQVTSRRKATESHHSSEYLYTRINT